MDMGVRQAPMALTSHNPLPNRSGWLRCGEGSVVRPNKPLELTPLRGHSVIGLGQNPKISDFAPQTRITPGMLAA
jgi:hypothetical protein